MSYYRIDGTNGFIEFKDGVVTVRRKDNNTFGLDDSRIVIDANTYPFAKLPRSNNAFFSVMEEKPKRGEFSSYDHKKDMNAIHLSRELEDAEVIAFMQTIWDYAENLRKGKEPATSASSVVVERKDTEEQQSPAEEEHLVLIEDKEEVSASFEQAPLSLKRIFPKSMPPMPTFAPKSAVTPVPAEDTPKPETVEAPQVKPVTSSLPAVPPAPKVVPEPRTEAPVAPKQAVRSTPVADIPAVPTERGSQWFLDLSTERVRDYAVVDIETTGLDTIDDRIIELGVIRYVDDVEVGRFSTLVRPYTPNLMAEYTFAEFEELVGTTGIKYLEDPYITELTGITNDMLSEAPTADQVAPAFFDFIGNLPVVGHNFLKFDLEFLRNFASDTKSRTSLGHDVIDTMEMAGIFAPEAGSRSLAKVCNHYGIKQNAGHRALDDALSTALIYQAMKKQATDAELKKFRKYDNRHLSHLTIFPNPAQVKENSTFKDKVFVLTGDMLIYRGLAMQHIVNNGGQVAQSITRKTSFLVVADDNATNAGSKLRKMYQQKQSGQDIKLINETNFYHEIDIIPPVKERVAIIDAGALDYAQ